MLSLAQNYIEVCIFKFDCDRVSYLVLQRSKTEEVYPDLWQFVTGSIYQNETAVEAAIREVREETSLECDAMWVVPYVNIFYENRRNRISLSPIFAMQVKPGTRPVMSHEHQRFEWLTYDDARRQLVWPGQREGLRIVREFIVAGAEAAKHSRIR